MTKLKNIAIVQTNGASVTEQDDTLTAVLANDTAKTDDVVSFTCPKANTKVTDLHVIITACPQTFGKDRWLQKKHLKGGKMENGHLVIKANKSYLTGKVDAFPKVGQGEANATFGDVS
jgi:hypothetical protein